MSACIDSMEEFNLGINTCVSSFRRLNAVLEVQLPVLEVRAEAIRSVRTHDLEQNHEVVWRTRGVEALVAAEHVLEDRIHNQQKEASVAADIQKNRLLEPPAEAWMIGEIKFLLSNLTEYPAC